MKPIAYSLIRFSVPKAADGDSYRRQFSPQQRFCDQRGWELDLALHHSTLRKFAADNLRKFAVSASKDIKKTPFYRFVMMVEAGGLPRDRQLILLAEDIDRMARGIHDVVYDLCLRLFRAGCWLSTTTDGEIYTLANINSIDSGKRDKLQRKLDAAADYAVKLGSRVAESWVGRRERIAAGEVITTEKSPEWLDVVDGKFALNPVRTATLRHIHRLGREHNMGKRSIAQLLNGDIATHPAWRAATWHPSAVQRVLENRAVFGEANFSKNGDDGKAEVVQTQPRYYPPALADTYEEAERLFYLGEAARKSRTHVGPVHKDLKFNTLVTGLGKCSCEAFDKHRNVKRGTLVYVDKSRNNRYLACDHALRKVVLTDGSRCNNHRHYHYPTLEAELLAFLPLFDVSRLLSRPVDTHAGDIAGIEAEIAAKTKRTEWLREYGDMDMDTMRSIKKLAGEIETAREKLAGLHRDSVVANAQATRDAHAEFTALVNTMNALDPDDDDRKRTRGAIAQELRRIIGAIETDGADDLIVWLPQTPHWRIGFRFHAARLRAVVCDNTVTRQEWPITLADAPEGLGELERYVNGAAVAAFENRVQVQSAAIMENV